MTSRPPVQVIGWALMASVVVFAGVALALPAMIGTVSGAAAGYVAILVYVSAASLLVLAVAAPAVARRLGSTETGGQGAILAMALAEGAAMAGMMGAGLVGQPVWVLALAVTGLIVILRAQSAAT